MKVEDICLQRDDEGIENLLSPKVIQKRGEED